MKQFKFICIITLACLLSGCFDQNNSTAADNTPLLKVETKPLLTKKECDQTNTNKCVTINIANLETNVEFVNEFLAQELNKEIQGYLGNNTANTEISNTVDQAALDKLWQTDLKSLTENLHVGTQKAYLPQFIAQRNNLGMFKSYSYNYNDGAAHGMYITKYFNFDLNAKKLLTLDDILLPDAENKLADKLFKACMATKDAFCNEKNRDQQNSLTISNNFTFTEDGIVFIYPLYTLAPYSSGEIKLILFYDEAKAIIKPEFLPY